MDEVVYEALRKYFHALGYTGYISDGNVLSLLVLVFYRDFVYQDYRGRLGREDYHLIEQALNCLFGTTCLMPYPDYLKMGKLKLGEITEMAQRIKVLEDTNVLKVIDDTSSIISDIDSDIVIVAEEDGQ